MSANPGAGQATGQATASAPATPLIRKLDEMLRRFDEVEAQLADPSVFGNGQKLVALTKEKGQLEPVVIAYRNYRQAVADANGLRELIGNKSDPDMAELA